MGVVVQGFVSDFRHPIPIGIGQHVARIKNDRPISGDPANDFIRLPIAIIMLFPVHDKVGGSLAEDRPPRQNLSHRRRELRAIEHDTDWNVCRSNSFDRLGE